MLFSETLRQLSQEHKTASSQNNMAAIEELIPKFELLLNEDPSCVPVLFGLGTCHLQLGHNGAAITFLEKTLSLKEDLPEVWNNLGSAWKGENKNLKAETCWLQALEYREDADYYNNLTTLYVNEGTPERGLPFVEKGLALNPDHARLHWNNALLLLEQGKWGEGFGEYEWGLISNDRMNRNYSCQNRDIPFWRGEKLGDGEKIVVYGEQGMGDEIMFSRAIDNLAKEIGREHIIFECHPRMVALFERSFGVKCYGTRKAATIDWPNEEPGLKYKIAVGSLFGGYFRDGVFDTNAYLVPDADLVAHYREKLQALGPGPYVGVAWSAGHKRTRNDLRSFKLREFLPIFEQGGQFVSMQYTDVSDKVSRFNTEHGMTLHHWPELLESHDTEREKHPGYDYDHTVALTAALDLIICPNTTLVHLCGAIGTYCWTMTPSGCAWRYQLTGAHMPMYGNWVTQWRETDDNWFQGVVDEYRELNRLRGPWSKHVGIRAGGVD